MFGERPVDVSVLVPTLNEEQHIRAALDAMREQRYEGEIEFLIIDGRSDDRTLAVAHELAIEDSRIRVLDNPARRTPHALNIGLRSARGEYIARMDAHTFYPPEYIAKGVDRLRRGDVAWVSGPQIPHGVDFWSHRVAQALASWLGTGGSGRWSSDGRSQDEDAETDLQTGVFTGLWRRETLEAHCGWDEGWPTNQDSELAARFAGRGQRIVSVRALGARYVPRSSLAAVARQYWRYGYYRAKTSQRHPGSLRRGHVLAPGVVLAALGSLWPGPHARPARIGLAFYLLAVLEASSAAAGPNRRFDPALPLIFFVMHGAWGAGFLARSFRTGPPLRALVRVSGLDALSRSLRGRGRGQRR